ncbi:MAG: hypothetical protein WDN69_27215 [Aliidongia sp.]
MSREDRIRIFTDLDERRAAAQLAGVGFSGVGLVEAAGAAEAETVVVDVAAAGVAEELEFGLQQPRPSCPWPAWRQQRRAARRFGRAEIAGANRLRLAVAIDLA